MKTLNVIATAIVIALMPVPTIAAAPKATLIYSANLNGELEPCGCSAAGDFGGILRRATQLDKLRSNEPDIILVSAGGILASEVSSDSIKNAYILKGFQALDYDAIGVQWPDLAYGAKMLSESKLPFTASNWKSKDISSSVLIRRNGVKLRVFQWLDPSRSPYRKMKTRVVQDSAAELIRLLKKSRNSGETTLVGTTLNYAQASKIVPMNQVDILIIESKYEVFGDPQIIGSTLVLQAGSRGMRLGELKFSIKSGGRIDDWSHRVIPLPNSLADAPRLLDWYNDYNQEVKTDYQRRVALRKAKTAGKQSPYLGADGCKACHSQSAAVWAKSEHAKAFEDLENVGKEFDPNCLQCHTVAMGKEGGFLDQYMTSGLTNVQCENCHGAGRTHAESGGSKPIGLVSPVAENICAQCHNKSHSPNFSFGQYWPRIMHEKEKPK